MGLCLEGTLRGHLQYSDALFNAQTMERMAQHYTVLLSSAVSQSKEGVLGLVFIDEEERQQVRATTKIMGSDSLNQEASVTQNV